MSAARRPRVRQRRAPAIDEWVVTGAEFAGFQRFPRGERQRHPAARERTLYQPSSTPNPIRPATSAEIIGTAIYHAIGYNVVDTYR
jgi:hypothetical protein